jgi:hypothetical protein
VVDHPPVIAEKPYLYIDDAGKYFVRVPSLREADSSGISWASPDDRAKSLSIDKFYLAHPGDTPRFWISHTKDGEISSAQLPEGLRSDGANR